VQLEFSLLYDDIKVRPHSIRLYIFIPHHISLSRYPSPGLRHHAPRPRAPPRRSGHTRGRPHSRHRADMLRRLPPRPRGPRPRVAAAESAVRTMPRVLLTMRTRRFPLLSL
jgi:hypothetical protein